MPRTSRARVILALTSALVVLTASRSPLIAQDQKANQAAAPKIGANYSGLDDRRRRLIDDWVARFDQVTGAKADPATFYDTRVRLSSKTTFDAVTNALMTTTLSDDTGKPLGDALQIIEHIDGVTGQVTGARGDQQFRMYARLTPGAVDLLERSREFRRVADNTVYHKGYPISYRQQGGVPSVQVSISSDHRHGDVDVDYRDSSFPKAIFNGHLTASNSDVRAGNNYALHANRWSGFQDWWDSFFGLRARGAFPSDADTPMLVPDKPRIGDKTIDLMTEDFLKAWLVDADVPAAMAYVSERAYACLAEDSDDPMTFNRGAAPMMLFSELKNARDLLGPRTSLDGLTIGVRLRTPGLKLVQHAHQGRYVLYSVPDDIAMRFDCESRLLLGEPKRVSRAYGRYFGATFYVDGPGGRDTSIALLWARDRGYWKIVSWQADPDDESLPLVEAAPAVSVTRIKADSDVTQAARGFLDAWLIRQDYDEALRSLAPQSYACAKDRNIRSGLEAAARQIGHPRRLEDVIESVEPIHPDVRVMDHAESKTFALASVPDAMAANADCTSLARGERPRAEGAPTYGSVFGMGFRLKTQGGEAPVLRTIWKKDGAAWRIVFFDVETP